MMGGWERVYDDDFAHVYDGDSSDRIDLKWDGEHLTIEGDAELNMAGVTKLRKLLQALERRS